MSVWLLAATDTADAYVWLESPWSLLPRPPLSASRTKQWFRRLRPFLAETANSWPDVLAHPLMPFWRALTQRMIDSNARWHVTMAFRDEVATFGPDNWEWAWHLLSWLSDCHGSSLVVWRFEPLSTDATGTGIPWKTVWGLLYWDGALRSLSASEIRWAAQTHCETGEPLPPEPFVRYEDGQRLLQWLRLTS